MAKKTDLSQETEATLIKGRLSDDSSVRAEACGLPFQIIDNQTSDGAHKHAFPYSHIEESTIHQPQAGPLIADRAVNFMEIGDFLMLWTYSQ